MRSSLKVIYLIACTLQDLISSDEDMDEMYLTEKRSGINDQPHDHEELEILLESFSKQVEEIVNEAANIEVGLHHLLSVCSDFCMQTNVQSTQEIAELLLDSNRNALLALDLKVSLIFWIANSV